MVIGVADFAVQQAGYAKDIPVYSYVFNENADLGFESYRIAPAILQYYSDKIGPYAYKKLANVQSKTIFGGMENAGAIFYFENSVGFKGIEELMAHEIAHQWFGDAASEKSFRHLWLSEGFATFMTNVYLENKYGTDTLQKRLYKQRETVISFEQKRFTPVVDTDVESGYMQLLNANSYQKGGWILQMLREKLGEAAFWKGIRAYYARYDGSNASTDDLRRELEQASGKDLKDFFKQWLYTAGTPHLEVSWRYDEAQKFVKLHIEQKQDTLFTFPLEVAINSNDDVRQTSIKDRITDVTLPANSKPQILLIDPKIKLLAQFKIIGE
jgi:aminopeptidase N